MITHPQKKIIRHGGSTAPHTVNTVLTVYTTKTAQTVTCMPIYNVRERTLLEWADALLSQKMGRWMCDGLDTP